MGVWRVLPRLAEADCRLAAGRAEDAPDLIRLREDNARQLELLVDEDGWPTVEEAGLEGCEAALHIALNASTRPAFQRRCLTMLAAAEARGEVPAGMAERLAAVIDTLASKVDKAAPNTPKATAFHATGSITK